MALTNVSLFGGAFLTPVIVGKIAHTLGWEWSFYLVAIFTAVAFPFMFFFVPETAFRRADYFNTDFAGDGDHDRLHRNASDESETQDALDTAPNGNEHPHATTS